MTLADFFLWAGTIVFLGIVGSLIVDTLNGIERGHKMHAAFRAQAEQAARCYLCGYYFQDGDKRYQDCDHMLYQCAGCAKGQGA